VYNSVISALGCTLCVRERIAIMKRKAVRWFPAIAATVVVLAAQTTGGGHTTASAPQTARKPRSPRLSVFDCGILHIADTGRFQFKKQELATTDLSVACFLVTHPKGTLIWDAGAVPDGAWAPNGNPTIQHILLPDSQQRDVTMVKSLKGQLAELGYSPPG